MEDKEQKGERMKRKPDLEELQFFVKHHYKSRKDFRKALGISQSHLYSILNGDVALGDKVLNRLEKECNKVGVKLESLLKVKPMLIGGINAEEIQVTLDRELIVSITSRDIIEKTGYKVEIVPYQG